LARPQTIDSKKIVIWVGFICRSSSYICDGGACEEGFSDTAMLI
jgi:hypothetical protein